MIHFDQVSKWYKIFPRQFDLKTNTVIKTTYSVDGARFETFAFQSGLMNGKGRFWKGLDSNNGAPLERFKIRAGTSYRFRVIGAMFSHPMRVFIHRQHITLRSSDAYNINQFLVQSVIINPGERFDFYWQTPEAEYLKSKEILIVAETLETPQSLNFSKFHAAEAVLEFEDFVGIAQEPSPTKSREAEVCTAECKCLTFNCPYKYYPTNESRECISFDVVKNIDPNQHYADVEGDKVDEEYFFNFGFPGPDGNTPSAINGRRFYMPTVSLLTQRKELTTPCNKSCETNGICHCTYIQKIPLRKLIQFVLLDLGPGSGASHPVHLHGHSFYLMKTGYGTYDESTGKLLQNSNDINCTDKFNYCNTAAWADSSWSGGNVPGLNTKPPQKDTIILPTGGYVVIRFISDNPGMWFFHCHTDIHSSNGMAMIIEEGRSSPKPPKGFPACGDFLYSGGYVVIRFLSDNPGMWFFHCHTDIHSSNGMAMIIEEGRSSPKPPKGFPACGDFLYSGRSVKLGNKTKS